MARRVAYSGAHQKNGVRLAKAASTGSSGENLRLPVADL